MSDQETSGAASTVEKPKNDFVLKGSELQVKAPVVDVPAPAPTKAVEADDDEGEADQEDTNNDHSEGKKKRRGGFQKKIGRLEGERDFYKAELERVRSGTKPAEVIPAKADNATDSEPDPEKYTDVILYNKDLATWAAKQAIKDSESEKSKKAKEDADNNAFKSKLDKFQAGIDAVKKANPDFEELAAAFDGVKIEGAIRAALVEAEEMGAEITNYLFRHPEEIAALNVPNVTYAQVQRAFGRIEARIEAGKQSTGPQKAAVKATQAPPPITPVSQSKKASAGKFYPGMPYEDFKRLSAEERG